MLRTVRDRMFVSFRKYLPSPVFRGLRPLPRSGDNELRMRLIRFYGGYLLIAKGRPEKPDARVISYF